jgi:hypothetical protein
MNTLTISADSYELSPVPRVKHIFEYAVPVLKAGSGYLLRYAKAAPKLDGIAQT